jgi:endonuclease IV
MQKDPKGVMEKYGKNPEFMQIFQEFCKIMGTHFTDISKETPKKDPEAERIQKLMENDEEVKEILKDPQIQNLLQFLSQNQKVELNK